MALSWSSSTGRLQLLPDDAIASIHAAADERAPKKMTMGWTWC
jgi:hypothetical protein